MKDKKEFQRTLSQSIEENKEILEKLAEGPTGMERLLKLTERIPNSTVRKGVIGILFKYKDKWDWLPTSTTGKYHKHEVLLVDHIENALIVADRMVEEFKLSNADASKLYAAMILHDIGRAEQVNKLNTKVPDTDEYYTTLHKTLNYRYRVQKGSHPMLSAKIIVDADFQFCTEIAMMTMTHMSHWGQYRRHPQPSNRMQDLVCICDFLASRYDFRSMERIGVGKRH